MDISLGTIPADQYQNYKYNVMFHAYKWDPQVGSVNTIARHVVLLSQSLAAQLAEWAEGLAAETTAVENALLGQLHLAKSLGIPDVLQRELPLLQNQDSQQHVRLMRFDFHPTADGWAVSEVNSDVPAGHAEAAQLPVLAQAFFPNHHPPVSPVDSIYHAFHSKLPQGGTIAMVHATSFVEDRQVVQPIGDRFVAGGYQVVYLAPDNIQWDDGRPRVQGEAIHGLMRIFPLEWLEFLPNPGQWRHFFNPSVPACNPPIAILAQSKRLPLIWDTLGLDLPYWKSLLPQTLCPTDPRYQGEKGWILKPAMGRVGEGIAIQGAHSEKEKRTIEKAAKKRPIDWVAQRQFYSQPLTTPEGEAYHLCIGVYTVDGKAAGFYGRMSPQPHIDASAIDVAVLVASH